jgi:hypothetical protein
VREWSAEQQLTPALALDPDDGVLGSVEIAVEAYSEEEQVMGGTLWGLNQFAMLAQYAAQGTYFVTGLAEAGDVTGEFWTAERRSLFDQRYREGSLGAPPGLYATAAYEATWVALHRVAAQHGIEPGITPADTIAFAPTGRRIDAPVYLYRWENGQRTLADILGK